ncbi:MAG: hypothetical protein AAGI66_03220 [Cyanobacteria bacterium P01_H01_bin.74]
MKKKDNGFSVQLKRLSDALFLTVFLAFLIMLWGMPTACLAENLTNAKNNKPALSIVKSSGNRRIEPIQVPVLHQSAALKKMPVGKSSGKTSNKMPLFEEAPQPLANTASTGLTNGQSSPALPVAEERQSPASVASQPGQYQPKPGQYKPKPGPYQPKIMNWARKKLHLTTLAYQPAEAIMVFAIVPESGRQAFSDVSKLFGREFAIQLQKAAPESAVFNPVQVEAEVKNRGLDYLYEAMLATYQSSGAPDPSTTGYLLEQLSDTGLPVSRVAFVEAVVDMTHPNAATGILERARKLLTDDTQNQIKSFLTTRVQVFDSEDPAYPLVYRQTWKRPLPHSRYANVTPSVFDDTDSALAFAALSREISKELLLIAPRSAYMIPVESNSPQSGFSQSVRGQLAK